MCGRYTITTDVDKLAARFKAHLPYKQMPPRFNVAPGQMVPVILNDTPHEITLARWGLLPTWAIGKSFGIRPQINARAETVANKSMFRDAFHKRRCLVLADGFYAWKTEGERKVPYRFTLKTGEPFAFAGIWEQPLHAGGDGVPTFTIITTTPNELVAKVHDRMPVILPRDLEQRWLTAIGEGQLMVPPMSPYDAGEMKSYEVSNKVNSARCQRRSDFASAGRSDNASVLNA